MKVCLTNNRSLSTWVSANSGRYLHLPGRGNLERKGLISALGKWSNAHTSIQVVDSATEVLACIPRIRYPLAMMTDAGICKIIVACTPSNAVELYRLLRDGSDFGAQLSYVLVDDTTSIAQALVAVEEFRGQSGLLVAGGGVCCVAGELRPATSNVARGVVSMRMRRADSHGISIGIPELLFFDSRSLNKLANLNEINCLTQEIKDLRILAASYLNYSEVNLSTSCSYIELVDGAEFDRSALTDAMVRELLVACN